jgi:uncharacterized protein (TIGR02145 family)
MKRLKLFLICISLLIIGTIVQIHRNIKNHTNCLNSIFTIMSSRTRTEYKSKIIHSLDRDDKIRKYFLFQNLVKGSANFKFEDLYEEFANKITDIEGNVYRTMTIGKQVWMIENLKTTRYRNGDSIRTTFPTTLDISSETKPKYQWFYEGDEKYPDISGRLYTWYTINDKRGIAPIGWHIPTDKEWSVLTEYLGGHNVAGEKFQEIISINSIKASKENGIEKVLIGIRSDDGIFYGKGSICQWWSSDQFDTYSGSYWGVESHSSVLCWLDASKHEGLSVLCIKDK